MLRSLTPFLSAIIAVLLIIFYVHPQYTEVRDTRASVKAYAEASENFTAYKAEVDRLLKVRDDSRMSDRERLDVMIPKEINKSRLLVDLEYIATKNGMLFGNVSIDEEDIDPTVESDGASEGDSAAEPNELKPTNVSFAVIGTYAQFKGLLQSLERNLTLMEITNLGLTAAGENGLQQFELTVQVYSEK
jgi:hypothetical protein